MAKVGSIKLASEKLNVTQPTISDQIKLIEEYFNCSLFERKNRGLVLTREGRLALEYAEKIFDLGSELTSRLRNKVILPKRSIDIGISSMMSHYFLYDMILPLFKQTEITVNIKEEQRHLLLAELEEGHIDMVFTDNKDSISSTMDSYRVGVNKTFAVAHKKFRKFKKNFPQGLNEIPFFSYTVDSFLRYELELYFSKNSITPKVIGEGDDIELLQMVAQEGLGFVVVPEVAQKRLCQNKDLVILGELKELQTYVWAVVKKSYKGIGYHLLKSELEI